MSDYNDKKTKGHWFYLFPTQLKYGVTNCATGEISGKTNIKNRKLFITKEDGENHVAGKCTAYLGDGTERFYEINSRLSYEVRPSGNRVYYDHDNKDRISRIYTTDPTGQMTLGWMDFTYDKKKRKIHVVSSNGKKATYALTKHLSMMGLTLITGHPDLTFKYKIKRNKKTGKRRQIGQISWNDGGSIKLDYHHDKVNSIYLSDVKVYDIKYNEDEKKTIVKDIEGGKNVYTYSHNRRLKSKERYCDDKTLYSSQMFFWGGKPKKYKFGQPIDGNEGNLITKGIANSRKELLSLISYTYDIYGNVLSETIAGHLTGYSAPKPFEIKDDCRPNLQGMEAYSRHYTYSDDRFNLVTSMQEDNGLFVTWSYLPNTNKPTEKLTYADGEIVAREFFEYNHLGILVKNVVDDGNVTQRVITRIFPNMTSGTPGFGKPHSIIESYEDPESGLEHQLKRINYTYGIYDLVTQETYYDAEDKLRYTISYKYDSAGNCIEETDSIGRLTIYRYNERNLCVYKELVRSGFSTTYVYDKRGRLIKTEDRRDSGEVFVQSYQYDNLDRKICEIDNFGNKTTYQYDVMGRLVAVHHPSFVGEDGSIITPVELKSYNIWDQVTAETDTCGYIIQKRYNCRGQLTEITYPDNTRETCRYNLNGTLHKKQLRNGSYQLFSYDAQKRPIREESYSSDGKFLRSKEFHYEGNTLIREIDAMGHVIEYKYDGAGRKIAQIRDGLREEYQYDSLGRLSTIRKWYGAGENDYTQFIKLFDNLDRLVEERVEDAHGHVFSRKTYAYDINGNCTETANYQSESSLSIQQIQYNTYHLPINWGESQ